MYKKNPAYERPLNCISVCLYQHWFNFTVPLKIHFTEIDILLNCPFSQIYLHYGSNLGRYFEVVVWGGGVYKGKGVPCQTSRCSCVEGEVAA